MSTERFAISQFENALHSSLVMEGYSWECIGYKGNELHYRATIRKGVVLQINSSIGLDGFADDTGDNSIRIWLTDDAGKPLAKKEQAYVTRVKGWADRMHRVIQATIKSSEELIASPECPKCGGPMVERTRRSDGKKFWGCTKFAGGGCNGTRDWDYAASKVKAISRVEQMNGQSLADKARNDKVAEKTAFAELEAKQEREAFMSDPDLKNVDPAPVALAKKFQPSLYQANAFRWVTEKVELRKHTPRTDLKKVYALFVEAVAGSGKTTTGLEMLKLLDPTELTLFVAFGKRIATHLRDLAPKYVNVSTYHSLGFKALSAAFGHVEKDDDKVIKIINTLLNKDDWKHTFPAIMKLVSLVKANLSGTNADELLELADHYGVELNGDQQVILETVPTVIRKCKEQTKFVDFDDMCWLPVVLNLPMKKYDNIFIDEAQDSNKVQIQLAIRSIKPGGIIMACGDRKQSMFGFRGADVNAIPNLIAALDCEQLPLSRTYRCPKSHVRLVNKDFPGVKFEAADDAIEGIIRTTTQHLAASEYKVGDMVICRTNAPLVSPAFELIRRGIKAVIVGKEIGRGLSSLIDKMRCSNIHDLLEKLTVYKNEEVSKLLAAEKTNQAQNLIDKVETIIALTDGINSITELHKRINDIFSDDAEGVTFSSVHRAKGLEAERVYILHPELMPHPMSKKDWEKEQEDNIKYVAETRSRYELVWVVGD